MSDKRDDTEADIRADGPRKWRLLRAWSCDSHPEQWIEYCSPEGVKELITLTEELLRILRQRAKVDELTQDGDRPRGY